MKKMQTITCTKCGKPFEGVGVDTRCVPCYVSEEMSWIFE